MAEQYGIEPSPGSTPDAIAFQAMPITIRDTAPLCGAREGTRTPTPCGVRT